MGWGAVVKRLSSLLFLGAQVPDTTALRLRGVAFAERHPDGFAKDAGNLERAAEIIPGHLAVI